MSSLNNPEADGSQPGKIGRARRLSPGKRVFLFFLFALGVGFVPTAEAGIRSLVANIFSTAAVPSSSTSLTTQNISLLEASPTLGAPVLDTQIVVGGALLADAGPLGAAADFASTTPASSDQISVYTVRPGDTLSGIADMFNVSINTILWSNDLKKGTAIQPGQKLVILPISGVRHTVRKGDTIASVAKKYGGDPDEIIAFNNLDGKELIAGATIIIPDGEAETKTVVVDKNGKKQVVAVSNLPTVSGFVWPVAGGRFSQGIHGHNGIDIAAPIGTPALASAAGTVLIAKDGGWNGAYGSYVVIKHSNGTQTLYAHLSSVAVAVGQKVVQGQKIGGVGNTGRSTGPHLHFEVRGAKNPFANGR